MNEIEEAIEKQRAHDSARVECGTSDVMGMAGQLGRYTPPTFREQMGKRLEHAKAEGKKAGKLQELCILLDKNREVARILDLIEEVGKY